MSGAHTDSAGLSERSVGSQSISIAPESVPKHIMRTRRRNQPTTLSSIPSSSLIHTLTPTQFPPVPDEQLNSEKAQAEPSFDISVNQVAIFQPSEPSEPSQTSQSQSPHPSRPKTYATRSARSTPLTVSTANKSENVQEHSQRQQVVPRPTERHSRRASSRIAASALQLSSSSSIPPPTSSSSPTSSDGHDLRSRSTAPTGVIAYSPSASSRATPLPDLAPSPRAEPVQTFGFLDQPLAMAIAPDDARDTILMAICALLTELVCFFFSIHFEFESDFLGRKEKRSVRRISLRASKPDTGVL